MLPYDWGPTHRLQLQRGDFGESKLIWVYSYVYLGGSGGGLSNKVASNRLKIGQRVVCGEAVIATRVFCAWQNSYGFRAIWSWFTILAAFQILRDLLMNLILGKINLCSFFPAQQMTYIKNWIANLEDLSIDYHLPKQHILCQNPCGFRSTIKLTLK